MAEQTQWEYRVEIVGGSLLVMKDAALTDLLNAWGEQGWEVFAVFLLPNSSKMRVIARRPLSLASRRRRSWPND